MSKKLQGWYGYEEISFIPPDHFPDHLKVVVFCNQCFDTNHKMVVFYGNPYLFKCPICGSQTCSNLKLHLDSATNEENYELTLLLREAEIWGKKLEEGQYYCRDME